MLTHGNVIADCTPMKMFNHIQLCHEDVMISYLPLAHMFERILEVRRFAQLSSDRFRSCVLQITVYMHGGRVGFYQGDIRRLTDDIQELRPTFVPAVPRVLNRIYDRVSKSITSFHFWNHEKYKTKIIFEKYVFEKYKTENCVFIS